MEELVKYIIAVAKLNPNDEEASAIIAAKLKELVNGELCSCIDIAGEIVMEWGETAVRANKIAAEIASKIKAKMRT